MADESVDFLNIIQEQRRAKKQEKFKGNFLDYLSLIKEDPDITMLSHKRLYDALMSHGQTSLVEKGESERCRKLFSGEDVKVYDYFDKSFFGMERVIAKLMRFLRSASLKGEESRQILLLMGPVGAGKSDLMEHIKRALEGAPKFYHLEGCPIHEEPLHLLPRSLRKQFEEILGVKIEGDLCPVCRHRLSEEFNNCYEDFPVVQSSFSIRGRRGIAEVPPTDANTQDVSILIGTEDLSKLDKYPEDDPRVLSLNGAFNRGNRGIVEFIEIFKNDVEFMHPAITATQEKRVPAPGKHPMIDHDVIILSHCNESEWNKFKSDRTNEAILDRVRKIEVPYVLEVTEEQKIYRKRLGQSNFDAHIAPHTIRVASLFSVMTRLKPSNKCDLITKAKIYDGEEVIEKGRTKKIDIKDLREEAFEEGMSGVSTRFIMKAIDEAIANSDKNMVTPISIMDELIVRVKEDIPAEDDRTRYLYILQKSIRDEYLNILEKEIARAFITAYEQQAESLFDSYLDNAEAYTNHKTIKNSVTREEREPDEDLMTKIEEQIGITGSARDGFRQDVTSYMFSLARRGETINYKSHKPLQSAIEHFMMSNIKDMARIVTKTKTRDKDQKKKYNEMVETMIQEYGYNESSAEEILTFAANNLWRDS